MNEERARDLMRLYDGELSEARAAELMRAVEADAEALLELRELNQVGQAVRVWAEARTADFDIAEAVMKSVQAAPRDASLVRAKSQPSQSGQTLRFNIPQSFKRAVLPAAASLAAAAALVLYLAVPQKRSADTAAAGETSSKGVALALDAAALARPGAHAPSVVIEAVDFGSGQGSIFLLEEGDGATPVVWLADADSVHNPSQL